MRSSRSAADAAALLGAVPAFAHRGLHDDILAENGLAAFRAAIAAGMGLECDVRLTRDGAVVVFHDHRLDRLTGAAGTVEGSGAAALARLRLAGGEPIPTLADLLAITGDAPLLIEAKCQSGNHRALAAALAAALAGFGGRAGLMSFDPRIVRRLRGRGWPVGLVVRDSLPGWKRAVAMAIARPDFLAVETHARHRGWVRRRRVPAACWTVRDAQVRGEVTAAGLVPIVEGDGRPHP